MNPFFTFVFLFIFFGGEVGLLAQDTATTRKALLGNSPKTTVTTGIGQVVTPVGTPVIRSPLSVQGAFQKPAPPPPTGQEKKLGKEQKLPLEAEKVEGKYQLGEVPQKGKKGEDKNYPILSDRTANAGPVTYSRPQRKAPVTRIPYSQFPPVQKIPSQQ